MIDAIGAGLTGFDNSGVDKFANIDDYDIEKFDFMLETEVQNFSVESGVSTQQNKDVSTAALDYMVSSKNSLMSKSQAVHDSYLGDQNFTFTDKIQLLEKTYNYQLEMTFYNTFMSQTMQKVDSLIQLK